MFPMAINKHRIIFRDRYCSKGNCHLHHQGSLTQQVPLKCWYQHIKLHGIKRVTTGCLALRLHSITPQKRPKQWTSQTHVLPHTEMCIFWTADKESYSILWLEQGPIIRHHKNLLYYKMLHDLGLEAILCIIPVLYPFYMLKWHTEFNSN